MWHCGMWHVACVGHVACGMSHVAFSYEAESLFQLIDSNADGTINYR
jgi:hypothetical protein